MLHEKLLQLVGLEGGELAVALDILMLLVLLVIFLRQHQFNKYLLIGGNILNLLFLVGMPRQVLAELLLLPHTQPLSNLINFC